MSRLNAEFERLYGLQPGEVGTVVPGQKAVRWGGLSLARPADWDGLQRVWQGVQADLGLPAPAIAVNGVDGFQLWFSVSAPVPVADMAAFLEGLQARYLGGIDRRRVSLWPAAVSAPSGMGADFCVPAQKGADHWSAFVTPDLARIFSDDPWLDMAPADASQADVLAGLSSARPDVFEAACARLGPAAPDGPTPQPQAPQTPVALQDPETFLRQVMNDAGAPLALRIEAAKALLTVRP